MKNLYLISQNKNNKYDTYDSAVVVAENEDDARMIHPSDTYGDFGVDWISDSCKLNTWCKPEYVDVKLIGKAVDDIEDVVICASFNAG